MSKFSKQYEQGYADGRASATNDRKYNGWSNYETWNVKLWMDNEESSYRYWLEETERAIEMAEPDQSFTRQERAALSLAKQIESDYLENIPEVSGTYGDLLRGAMSDVNWYEIAASMVEDYVSDHPEVLAS